MDEKNITAREEIAQLLADQQVRKALFEYSKLYKDAILHDGIPAKIVYEPDTPA